MRDTNQNARCRSHEHEYVPHSRHIRCRICGIVVVQPAPIAIDTQITVNAIESMQRSELEQTCTELERFRQERSSLLEEVSRLNAWVDELGRRVDRAEGDADFEKGYDQAIGEVLALLREIQRQADSVGNDDIRWPAIAATRIEVTFKRKP